MILGTVSANADDARRYGFLRRQDVTVYHPDRLLTEAKALALTAAASRETDWGQVGGPVGGMIDQVFTDLVKSGEITEHDVSIWKLAALKGLFQDVVEEPVSYVNAPLLAQERGCEVRLLTDPNSPDFRNVTTLRGTLAEGTVISVAGTLTGPRMIEKVVGVNGFDLEVPISQHMAYFTYVDRPGVVGNVGHVLGEAGINIGGMQVAPDAGDGHALMVLNIDSKIPEAVLAEIRQEIGATTVSVVDLDG